MPDHHRKLAAQPLKHPASASTPTIVPTQPTLFDSLTALQRGHFTAAHVLTLQRSLGNQTVQRLLQREPDQRPPQIARRPIPAVQRVIGSGIGNLKDKKDEERLLNKFKNPIQHEFYPIYQQAQQAGMTDEDLKRIIKEMNEAPELYFIADVQKRIEELARNRQDNNLNERQQQSGGVTFTIIKDNYSIPGGLNTEHDGQTRRLKVKTVEFTAEVMVEGPSAEQTKEWQVGFIQTVTSLDRYVFVLDKHDGMKRKQIHSTLPGPRRDGPKGYTEPWFDPKSYSNVSRSTDFISTRMPDTPSLSADFPGRTFQGMTGCDTFRTWLVARKKDGSAILYLKMWRWNARYHSDPSKAASLGAAFDGTSPAGDGTGAVLDGPVGKDAIQTTFEATTLGQQEVTMGALLPSQEAFQEMKKNAKRKNTPFSGMLPVKKYGQLVATFHQAVSGNDWTAAKRTIDELKAKLDLMNEKTTENYWQSNDLKNTYFMPIYNAVCAQQRFVNTKLS